MRYTAASRKVCHQSPNLIVDSVRKKLVIIHRSGTVCEKIRAIFNPKDASARKVGATNAQNTKVIPN
jgi:hypothetical protein